MTPDQIIPGHTYETEMKTRWTVISVSGDAMTAASGLPVRDSVPNFARYAVRDITPAPESDQVEKVAQATNAGACGGDGGEMLPCPFCGSDETSFDGPAIECLACGASGPSLPDGDETTDAEVIAVWNRRALSAAVGNAELLEAARAVASQIDYLQGLWGKEAITQRLVERLESAIARAEAVQ